jgi:hypothetical protein
MIFFVLGLTHEAGIQNMIARDTEDVLEREALEEITSKHINSHRMELAHHNATGSYNNIIELKITKSPRIIGWSRFLFQKKFT